MTPSYPTWNVWVTWIVHSLALVLTLWLVEMRTNLLYNYQHNYVTAGALALFWITTAVCLMRAFLLWRYVIAFLAIITPAFVGLFLADTLLFIAVGLVGLMLPQAIDGVVHFFLRGRAKREHEAELSARHAFGRDFES